MKIAFLVGNFPSLSETFVLNQITGLIDLGHEIDIYATRPFNLEAVHRDVEKYDLLSRTFYYPVLPSNYWLRIIKGIGILLTWGVRYPFIWKTLNFFQFQRYASSFRFLYQTVPFLKQRLPKYDFILCHFGHVGKKGNCLRKIGAVQGKLGTVFHGWDLTEYIQEEGKQVYDELFSEGDLFLPISNRWKNLLVDLGCPKDKTFVHRMGIDCEQFKFKPHQPNSSETIHIATVARLTEKKGIEYGIRAAAKIKQAYPNFSYTIVGDGPLKADLESLIQQLHVENVVKLLGWKQRDDVIAILNRAVFLLAPSVTARNGDQEGIPVAIMEAMAMGLVVVSTQHSGIPELVVDKVSGFLAAERDADALAELVICLIQQPELCREISQRGRTQVEENYDIQQLNLRLSKLLEEAVASPQKRNPTIAVGNSLRAI
ncbi:glycosyltransferase [Pseudanabaena sp. FACHB-2040]|uniref:glycosyltransferase n=1 Tax=Pseudanabaena sp. FACHB-2040 TaxID=2692859 RepID=UPI0016860693|nr:glycosyltransferase [Pseudanabaena sp. FACHB-2040]MBD2260574.1 glycosyltransferase [Pseudanabaena sp. FACHB-2040]